VSLRTFNFSKMYEIVTIWKPDTQIPKSFNYQRFSVLVIEWQKHLKTKQNSPDFDYVLVNLTWKALKIQTILSSLQMVKRKMAASNDIYSSPDHFVQNLNAWFQLKSTIWIPGIQTLTVLLKAPNAFKNNHIIELYHLYPVVYYIKINYSCCQ
jgi:hypothetical protein